MIQKVSNKIKVGTIAGLAGGFVIVISFFAIDSLLVVPAGTFYMMAGISIGLHDTNAVIFGFVLHMVTAIIIGVSFCICSTLHPILHLKNVWKGIFAGSITGIVVYAIFFMPITLYLIIPTIDSLMGDVGQTLLTGQEHIVVSVLKAKLHTIMWGALVLHVFFGSTMGLFSTIMLRRVQDSKKDSQIFKTNTP